MTATPYLRVHRAQAPKLGARASGAITYELLTDLARAQIFVTVVANEGGGNWNRELVPLRDIEEALAIVGDAPFRAKVLSSAFVGRSANNAGFLAAVLAAEGLITPSPEVKHHLLRSGNWAAWRDTHLAAEGEPTEFSPFGGKNLSVTPATVTTEAPPAKGRRGKGKGRTRDDTPVESDASAEGDDDAGDS